MNNKQSDNYYSRLKEVLSVTGKLTDEDLEMCKTLSELSTDKLKLSDLITVNKDGYDVEYLYNGTIYYASEIIGEFANELNIDLSELHL